MATSEQLNQFIKQQIERLRDAIDLHDLAARYGLQRPGGKGNYKADADDNSPSLSIYTKHGRQSFRDFRMGEAEDGAGGDFLDFDRRYGPGGAGETLWDQVKRLSADCGLSFEPPRGDAAARVEKSKEEWLADQCLVQPALAIPYLVGRGIPEDTVKRGIARKTIGYSDWVSATRQPRDTGYGGPAVAFLCRDLLTNQVLAVDKRFIDPDLNGGKDVEGGIKTQSFGQKDGLGWCIDRAALASAHTVVIVESAINALCVEACARFRWSAYAIRGTGNATNIDWHWCVGKRVILALDADTPGRDGTRPGAKAAWAIYDALTALNVAVMLVDWADWYASGFNDLADIAKAEGIDGVRERLDVLEPWAIPGLPGKDGPGGKSRVFLPAHDFAIYWRYRVKPDFTSYVSKVETDDDGMETLKIEDVAGFRIASLSRVSIASATSTMSGEADAMPRVVFAVSAQVPRHGPVLVRRVLDDDRLHNLDQWAKLGPIFIKPKFSRLLTILERTADLGAREAVNFVGLAWRDGKPIVNEGPDCYFTEPDKQCPYANLTFPSGRKTDAALIIRAYQDTFRDNAAAQALVWGLGGHLKAFLGFWPHLVMQADKGSGKSTLIKRLERTLGFTMFSGQSLQTEFRLVTSCSYTSQPVGWEELSARKQEIIDKAVGILQESYQHTVTKRGSDMTEYLLCAPVLLAGEDVPVKSLTGKIVRTDLTRRMGPKLPDELPRFPVREWLQWLATMNRASVLDLHARAEAWLWMGCRAPKEDTGARRMVTNYAAVLAAWQLLCEFAGMERGSGEFPNALRHEMNLHIKETAGDREPYVWILELLAGEIEAREYRMPYKFEQIEVAGVLRPHLILQPGHVMDHISKSPRLREQWNGLPVKTARVFRRQLQASGLVWSDSNGPLELDKVIDGRRMAHAWALDVEKMAELGISMSVPEPEGGLDKHFEAFRRTGTDG